MKILTVLVMRGVWMGLCNVIFNSLYFRQSALTPIIEGYHRNISLFMIEFNPYNIYALLYCALDHGNISISPNLGNKVWPFYESSYLFAFCCQPVPFSRSL